MSSKKNRDIAQELVDFLLNEDEKKKAPAQPKVPKPASKVAPKPASKPVLPSSTQAKTVAIAPPVPSGDGEEPTMVPAGKLPDLPEAEFEIHQNTPPPVPAMRTGESVVLAPAEEKAQAILEEATSAAEPLFEIDLRREKPKATQASSEKQSTKMPGAGSSFGTSSSGVPSPSQQQTDLPQLPKQPKPQDLGGHRAKAIFNEVSTLMAGAEAVKVAQSRITSLEKERDQLRDETEQLLQATETLQRRFNELKAQYDGLERKHREKVEILEDEKQVLRTRLKAREDELEKIKNENDELKLRFQSDLRKIRVRERELEHRQEIMKAEQVTLLQAKDEIILELKRQLERLHFELDNFRAKSADMNTKLNEYFERNHRTVKALRLALSVLEAGDNDDKGKKVS